MQLSEIRTAAKNLLFEDGVYRTDSFINKGINEGYKLVALFSLCDERRATVNIEGSRNFNALPRTGTAHMIAPIHVSNSHTGTRINCIRVEDLEIHRTEWEGKVESQGDSLYYLMLSPFHYAHHAMVLEPIQNIGRTQLTIIGSYIPSDLTNDTDEPRIPESFQDLLVTYAHYYGLIGQTGANQKAQHGIQQFMTRLAEFVISVKAKFPGGRDYEPEAPEFSQLKISELEKKLPRQDESR